MHAKAQTLRIQECERSLIVRGHDRDVTACRVPRSRRNEAEPTGG